MKSKDPKDFKKCELSTDWQVDRRYCTNCKNSCNHRENTSHICNSCGEFNTIELFGRSFREIFIDNEWKYQFKYKNGTEEIICKNDISTTPSPEL